jgi:RNA polymerase sigma-70 factor, ECF subfamily
VIRLAAGAHHADVSSAAPALGEAEPVSSGSVQATLVPPEHHARVTRMVNDHHDFIWRLLRRLGVPDADADDATQRVFMIAARRIADVSDGSERSFLFGTALRVAPETLRAARRQPLSIDSDLSELRERRDSAPDPEELVARHRARQALDEILLALPLELRTVLVLFELEQMTKTEVAELLDLPVGTAVSRLRRAREQFRAELKRRNARLPRRVSDDSA